ncbi:MAG: hypothetical protein M3396_03210, partial [Actinomycetota bacterium]|nr:hypothetical protein [Actinomycetota bacterium]
MTEIPEHLLRRAKERRAQLAGQSGAEPSGQPPASEATAAGGQASSPDGEKIPAHLLQRGAE